MVLGYLIKIVLMDIIVKIAISICTFDTRMIFYSP